MTRWRLIASDGFCSKQDRSEPTRWHAFWRFRAAAHVPAHNSWVWGVRDQSGCPPPSPGGGKADPCPTSLPHAPARMYSVGTALSYVFACVHMAAHNYRARWSQSWGRGCLQRTCFGGIGITGKPQGVSVAWPGGVLFFKDPQSLFIIRLRLCRRPP